MKIFVVTLVVLLGLALIDAERYCDLVKENLAENAVCPTDNSRKYFSITAYKPEDSLIIETPSFFCNSMAELSNF